MTGAPTAAVAAPGSSPSVTEAFAALDTALALVAAADLEALPAGARGEALLVMDRFVHRVEAQRLRMLAVFDTHGDAGLDGGASTAVWLRWRTRTAPGAASRQVRTARRLHELPELTAAHRAGEISAAHLEVVARKLDDSPARTGTITQAEGTFLETARKVDPQAMAGVVRRWVDAVDPLGAIEREVEQHHQRNLSISPTFDGAVHLSGLFPPESGALVKTALDALCSELHAADRAREKAAPEACEPASTEQPPTLAEPPQTPTPAQRRADALVELCRRYLGSGLAPRAGGARPHLSVMVPAATLESAEIQAGLVPAELAGLGPISTAATQRLGCEAVVTIYGLDATGRPTSYGRTQRVVPPGLRRYLTTRDQGCVFPGCARPDSWCEAHHLQFWSHGGATDASNLALICIGHHHALHEGGFTTRGDPETGTLRFYRPDGTALPGP